MLQEDKDVAIYKTRGGRRRRTYRTQVAGVLAAAFALSLTYSVIVTFTSSNEGYSMADPALWVFYAVGFGLVALWDTMWAWWVLAAAVLALIAVGIFYYPTIFPPSAQTPLAWFENDVCLGLLILAEYLCVQRLRRIDLTAGE